MKKIFLSTISLVLVFSMATPSVSAQEVGVSSLGPLGHWKFDESSWASDCLTADIMDSSGNGRHGTVCINGDAPFPVPGKFGNAGRFDGINQYANMGPGFNFTSSFTAVLWMALDDYNSCGPTGKSQHIIGTHDLPTPTGNGRGWGIYWDCDGLAWELTNSTGSAIVSYGYIQPSPFPANGSWHHIALVYDSTIPSATLYWDGVPVYSESGIANVPSFLYDNGEPLTVNGLPYAPSAGAPGKIDETSVYNRALSLVEIQTLFSNQPPIAVNDDSYETDEDTSLNITAPGLLENDSDPDGNPLAAVKVTDPANGTLNLNMDGSFTYMPNENYFGSDSFTYKANNGMWDSDIATVMIMINAVNDPPTVSISAPADGSSFTEGDSISFTGTAGDVEDGNLTPSLSWSSNLDGSIGTGISFSISTLSVGIHTVTTVVNDFGALVGSDQITITVEDTTAPDTTMDSQPPNPSGADVAFTFSSPDITATFECQLDNGGYVGCTTPQNYIGLANGPHTFDVRARDGEGNVDATPASFIWTVDTVSPSVVSITCTNGNPTSAMSVDFTIKFAESVSGVTEDDFVLYTTGVTGASIISLVSGSDSTYTVTVNTGSGNGTIRLDVMDNNTIIDAAGNSLGGIIAGDGDFTNGEVYEVIRSSTVELTVTADDQAISYGEGDPTFTFTYSGFQGSDDETDIETPPTCSVSGPHSDVDIYSISCTGAVDSDGVYVFTYVDGTLTINKATPTLSVTNSPVPYTGSAQSADVSSGSVVGTVDNVQYDGSTTAPVNAGTYAVTADFTPDDTTNYISLTNAFAGDFVIESGLAITLKSIGSQDGWILESSETSGVGGTLNKTATTLRLGDDAANRQYRSILSFNTALPVGTQITSVTLKFKYAGVSGTNPFKTHGNLLVDVFQGVFKGNSALQLGDFGAKGTSLMYKSKALVYTNTQVDNWYSQSLNPDDFGFINLDGVTQFRLRFSKDDNNDFGADFLRLYSGNAAEADRPQLIIEYYMPQE
jgi:hypothetical protein